MIDQVATRTGEPLIRRLGDDITVELNYKGLLTLSATITVVIGDGMTTVSVHARLPHNSRVICVCTYDGKFPSKKAMESLLVYGKTKKRKLRTIHP